MICPICHQPILPGEGKLSTTYQLSPPLSDYCHTEATADHPACRYTLAWIVPLTGVRTSTPPPTKSGQLALC